MIHVESKLTSQTLSHTPLRLNLENVFAKFFWFVCFSFHSKKIWYAMIWFDLCVHPILHFFNLMSILNYTLLAFIKLCFCSVFLETLCTFLFISLCFSFLDVQSVFWKRCAWLHVGNEAIDACVWSISGKENGQKGDWLIGLQLQNIRA